MTDHAEGPASIFLLSFLIDPAYVFAADAEQRVFSKRISS